MTASPRTPSRAAEETISIHLPELRAALDEQRRFRHEQLRELAQGHGHHAVTETVDPRDEVAHALRFAAITALRQIEDAIARMDGGTYGACRYCGAGIPLERLEILPMAALCLRCAHADQQRTG
jgi:DnaK suppressor protein